ncbi:hypothetical protein Cni_G01795 [Canna indica]|uniref:Uncharacterized protein n=1 Tax=Canna indica TaxID=4628 RepID=A0AAQ3JNS4_9LILI|nr:hypothetical protein Cni_G01795 [Canna indica]
MSATQSISFSTRGIILTQPNIRTVGTLSSIYQIPYLRASLLHAPGSCKFRQHRLYKGLVYDAPKNGRYALMCAFGKNGDSMNENKELLNKDTDAFRRQLTVQDLLREYMKGRQLSRSGCGGGRNFFGGGSGGDLGEPKGDGFSGYFHELLQVIMATIGVIFLYILITSGEELTRLTRDYIKYLFGAKVSTRMIRTMEKWHRICRGITWKEIVQQDWLEEHNTALQNIER